jgi:DNA (cytosine-5)-methyltransferase 1
MAWPENEAAPDVDRILRPRAYCDRCDVVVESVQSWKPRREVGRYRQAYVYCCSRCGSVVEPGWLPAAAAIDWSIPGERIGDRLKPKTRARIAAGIARYWGPQVVEAAGNTYDAASPGHRSYLDSDAYYRSWPVGDPLRTLHTTNSKALAIPVEGRDGKDAHPLDGPLRTQTTRRETALAHAPFIAELYGTSTARSVEEPAGTFTAGGNHHGLVMTNQHTNRARSDWEPMPTATTATGGGQALVTRHNNIRGDQGSLTTSSDEYLRTLTTTASQSVMRRPRGISAADLREAEAMVPEVHFRMFQPHEVAAGMAFPDDYQWQPPDRNRPVSNRDLVKAAGNAVTPPAARDLVRVGVDSILGEAA